MIQYGDLNRNVNTDEILLLLAELCAEYFIQTPSMFHMREYYVLKSQSHDPDTKMYKEVLSGENTEEFFNTMGDGIHIFMGRDTWEIVSR